MKTKAKPSIGIQDLPELPPPHLRKELKQPDSSGLYYHRAKGADDSDFILVRVEYGPSSGLSCRALKQGGAAECGFNHWSGVFVKV